MYLEVKNITFGYKKGVNIIENFNLKMDNDERVGIVAPSGVGKTTLCSMIAGYMKPQSGEILLNGESVFKRKGYNPVQMIWQHPEKSVDPKLRMKESMAEVPDIDEQLYEKLGIEKDWFNRYPAELSGGEIQRFCIARALGKKTRFLIADEISTMLDVITQAQIWSVLLEEIKKREIGLIAVTHSDALMDYVTNRKIILGTDGKE